MSLGIQGTVQPRLKRNGQSLEFYDQNQHKVFTYSKLKAFDAQGKELPAKMKLADLQIIISVTTAEAVWPITIDPLFVTETKVTGADSDAAAGDRFGWSVALSGDTVLVGAYLDDDAGASSGSAYVFVKPGTGWADGTETAKLTASDAASGDRFGEAVALSGDTALVGARNGDAGIADSGSAYVFVKPISGWATGTETAKHTASDAASGDGFGESVALFGATALVGAFLGDAGAASDIVNFSGSAYMFVKPATGWATRTETAKLTASDAVAGDRFGDAVALSGDTALVGAYQDDDGSIGTDFNHNSGSAYLYRFECGFSGSVAPSRWTMVAIPCDLGAANTVDDVFGDNFNSIDYQWNWIVYRRDEATDRYVVQGLTSPLVLGDSYWIFSESGGFWDAGDGGITTFTQSGNCASPRGCYEIDLTPPADAVSARFNMVGHPANIQTDWASVRFLVNGVLYTPFDADFNGFVANTLWKYNGNGYDSFDDDTPGMEGHLNTYDGIWVKLLGGSFGKTVKMLIPHGKSTGSPPGPPGASINQAPDPVLEADTPIWARLLDFLIPSAQADKPKWEQEWYVRLIAVAEDENLRDKNNVLGQLQDSVDHYDRHDLPELLPFAAPYLSLSFPHFDWGDKAGTFTSDYHFVRTGDPDQWVFEIKSDDPYRDIDLYWDGVFLLEGVWTQNNGKKNWTQNKQMDAGKLYGQMVLEDIDLGIQIKAADDAAANHYAFNMDGRTVRTFRWILKSKNGKSPSLKAIKASPSQSLVRSGYDPMEQIPQPGRRGG